MLSLGELRVTKAITIQGPGSSLLSIDASGNDLTPGNVGGDGSRAFGVSNESAFTVIDVKINGLTLTSGDAAGEGGSIRNLKRLAITDVAVTGNSSRRDGGVSIRLEVYR